MAAKDIVGDGGAVALPSGLNLDAEAWSCTVNADTAVYSTFSSRWKKSKITNGNVTGTVSGVVRYDTTSTKPVPLATASETTGAALASFTGAATLTATTGCSVSGSFNFTKVSLSRATDRQMSMTADFESDGEVIIAWDEA